jgi:ribonuclease T2
MSGLRRTAPYLAAFVALVLAAGAATYEDGPERASHHAQPGAFDYYVLVLGWSPTYCLRKGDTRHDPQCDTKRAHDFVLHGLWPQYAKGWPEDCYAGKRPWVPAHVIAAMGDIMPSKGLIIHEYKTHGTCSGLSPEDYFDDVRSLYDQVSVPASYDDPETQRFLSPAKIEAEFLAVNPWLQPDMIAVSCRGGKLHDVRLCFGRDLQPRACGANINQQRLCRAGRITVPMP